MSLYKFYDADDRGTQVYDIRGARYQQLLEVCFQNCTSVSMCVHMDALVDLLSIEPYCLPITPQVKAQYAHGNRFISEDSTYRIVHYVLAPEVKRFLRTRADGIFQWAYGWGKENPEDLAFFRPDGTVFFFLSVHTGECTLSPCEEEDVSLILSDPRWVAMG